MSEKMEIHDLLAAKGRRKWVQLHVDSAEEAAAAEAAGVRVLSCEPDHTLEGIRKAAPLKCEDFPERVAEAYALLECTDPVVYFPPRSALTARFDASAKCFGKREFVPLRVFEAGRVLPPGMEARLRAMETGKGPKFPDQLKGELVAGKYSNGGSVTFVLDMAGPRRRLSLSLSLSPSPSLPPSLSPSATSRPTPCPRRPSMRPRTHARARAHAHTSFCRRRAREPPSHSHTQLPPSHSHTQMAV